MVKQERGKHFKPPLPITELSAIFALGGLTDTIKLDEFSMSFVNVRDV